MEAASGVDLYVVDASYHRVLKMDAAGVSSFVVGCPLGLPCVPGSTNTELRSPQGVFVPPSGAIYISDRMNHRVVVVNAGGNAGGTHSTVR